MYYINYFFLYSIIGHIIESIIYLFCSGHSGFLYGYWTPIYGIGTILIIVIYNIINRFKIKKFIKIILLFLTCSIVLSIIEMIGGYLIELIFNKELWDYSNHKLNIGKYTSIEMSIIWGLSSIILIYFIKPFIDLYISIIPKYITYILIFLFCLDFIMTILIKTKLF